MGPQSRLEALEDVADAVIEYLYDVLDDPIDDPALRQIRPIGPLVAAVQELWRVERETGARRSRPS